MVCPQINVDIQVCSLDNETILQHEELCLVVFAYFVNLIQKQNKLTTYLEAVKICEELVVMALIGELWAFISPKRWQESAAHNFTMPARQPDRMSCPPGMNVNPQTQSLCALFNDCTDK